MLVPTVVYSEKYLLLNFGEDHPFQPSRFIATLELIKKYLTANIVSPEQIDWHLLVDLKVHSLNYIERVKACSKLKILYLSEYSADTPCFEGIFDWALEYCGGAVRGINMILDKSSPIVFNIAGGYHHAKYNEDGGFCVFNDCALAIKYVLKRDPDARPLYLDIDAHAGDGTYMILYEDPIPKISIHEDPRYLYPGRGFLDEVGSGDGYGFTLNIPLPPYSSDIEFISVLEKIVFPIIKRYSPTIIILQAGADGYFRDPLTHLNYTYESYKYLAEKLRTINIPIFICPGGGYSEFAPHIHTLLLGYLSFQEKNVSNLEALLEEDKKRYQRRYPNNIAEKLINRILEEHPIWSRIG